MSYFIYEFFIYFPFSRPASHHSPETARAFLGCRLKTTQLENMDEPGTEYYVTFL